MIAVRALLLWSAIIPLAIANGFLRDAVLVEMVGPFAARACSGVLLSGAILIWTYLTILWIGRHRLFIYAAVGAYWLALTIAFEFAFGRLVAKRSWDELFQSYRFEGGDLWPVVLVIVAIAPLLAAKLRHSA